MGERDINPCSVRRNSREPALGPRESDKNLIFDAFLPPFCLIGCLVDFAMDEELPRGGSLLPFASVWADGDKNTPRIARQEYYVIYVLVHARHGTGRSGVSFKCHTDRRCGSRVSRVDPTQTARLNKLFPQSLFFLTHTSTALGGGG